MFKIILERFSKPKFLIIPNSHLHIPTKTLVSDSHQNPTISKQFDDNPWPEWLEFMDHLSKNHYFDGIRRKGSFDAKDVNRVRTACLSFARHRVDLIRYLSRTDIWVVAGFGCPVVDRKVVNSAKRLRAHLGIGEENVCGLCSLRGNCERAYAKVRESDGRYNVDVMRLLLTYGLDHVTGVVGNKLCLNERVTRSVRTLLQQMVKYLKEVNWNPQISSFEDVVNGRQKSSTDWICSRCKIMNVAGNINCVQCDGQMRNKDRDRLELKKGDWLCEKCNLLNFAKNSRCLECNQNPPKRQLNGGEWECDSCNYINFRRNSVCIKCDHRPRKLSLA